MAILSTKAILIAGAGIALVGGAWAFSGSSEDPETGASGQVFEVEVPEGETPEPEAQSERSPERVLKMNISINSARSRTNGSIYLSDDHFKGFNNKSGVGNSGSDGAGSSISAADVAVTGQTETTVTNANEYYEVIYDIIDNKRVLVDHTRRATREEVMSEQPKVPFGMGERKISKKAKPEQEAALRKLMGQMTQARLDPKREIKLGNATGESVAVTVSNVTIDCDWFILTRAGGPLGKACFAPDSKVPLAPELRATLLKMPLPAADKDDYLSYLRQIAALQRARFPLMVRFEDELNPDNFEEWRVERTARADFDPDAFETPAGYSRPGYR